MQDRTIPAGSRWQRKFEDAPVPAGVHAAGHVGRGWVTLIGPEGNEIKIHVRRFFHRWERLPAEREER